MIKTEFMELLEELDTLYEGIEDVDFKALATAELEAERLRKEIFDLEKEYSNKVRTAVNADEQYNKFKAELSELQSQLGELKRTYERREWFRSGPDEYDHEDWVDEEAYAKVKDRVEELYADIKAVEDKLAKVETNVKQQFEAEAAILRDKQAEHKKHTDVSTTHKTTLKQAQEEVMPELKAVADYLNAQEGKKVWEVSKADLRFNSTEGRIIAELYTRFTEDRDFDTDDFDYDDSGELKDSVAEDAANDAAEDIGYTADQIIDAFGLEQSDEGWYKIPGSAWELSKEGEVFPYETPTFRVTHYYDATYWEPADWDYEEDGEFVVECRLTLGKKIHKATNEAVELDEARSVADIEADIARLNQELADAKVAEKKASYGGNTPTEVWYWDIYLDPSDKGDWTSIDNDTVFETENDAINAAYNHLSELDDEGELEYDPDDYTVEAIKIPLSKVSADVLEWSGLDHLI